MSNFQCEKCGTICYDTPNGYITGCEHYPADLKHNETERILKSVADFFEDRELTADQIEAIKAAASRKPALVKTRILPSRQGKEKI